MVQWTNWKCHQTRKTKSKFSFTIINVTKCKSHDATVCVDTTLVASMARPSPPVQTEPPRIKVWITPLADPTRRLLHTRQKCQVRNCVAMPSRSRFRRTRYAPFQLNESKVNFKAGGPLDPSKSTREFSTPLVNLIKLNHIVQRDLAKEQQQRQQRNNTKATHLLAFTILPAPSALLQSRASDDPISHLSWRITGRKDNLTWLPISSSSSSISLLILQSRSITNWWESTITISTRSNGKTRVSVYVCPW